MKKYIIAACCLLTLCGCMGHHHLAAAADESAHCASHDSEIDCDWNLPDRL